VKWPNLFVLTKSEQRVVILIVLILLAAAVVKRLREPKIHPFPTRSPAPVESTTPEDGASKNTPRSDE
jgi:hypothetical protein